MKAMVLEELGKPLRLMELPMPTPGDDQVLIEIEACAVCRTDLHVFDGDLTNPKIPLIPGHEIVGRVIAKGGSVETAEIGERVGVPWLGSTCGTCSYCESERENLCDSPEFTGYTVDGGFATHVVADSRYCFRLDDGQNAVEVAPLLCAGLIGFRAFKLALQSSPDLKTLGLYGFGAAAHILAQIAVRRGLSVFAFTREGDDQAQELARHLGAKWTGGSKETPPEKLDAAIIFAPVGDLVPAALKAVAKGGAVICGGIHMSEIPAFSYELLWEERSIKSVANLTRKDGEDFFSELSEHPVDMKVTSYSLEEANQALDDLRNGRFVGAAVLSMK